MEVKLNNNPINTCILQIKYSPLLVIESKLAILQDKFRKTGYPNYLEIEKTSIKLNEENKEQNTEKEKNWVFYNKDDKNNLEFIILNNRQLTYQVNYYSSFETFLSKYKTILDIFSHLVDLTKGTLIERIGLRYVNSFEGIDSSKRNLKQQYQGIDLSHSITPLDTLLINSSIRGPIKIGENDISNLLLRIYQNDMGIKTPMNVFSLEKNIPKPNNIITFLDIDQIIHFIDLQLKDLNLIYDYTKELNNNASKIFFNAITKDAIEAFK
ncbi:MAG: TIGR04255 family protein [Pleomorphochaeta sp.]